jgi:NADPH:quinone reductase
MVIYGAAGGEPGAVPATLYALRSITGFSLLAWRAALPEQARADVTEVTEHAAAGRLRTAVHARLPLTEAAKAHQILENREQLGRVLLVP